MRLILSRKYEHALMLRLRSRISDVNKSEINNHNDPLFPRFARYFRFSQVFLHSRIDKLEFPFLRPNNVSC
jgi:hypothetical protein